MWNNPLKKAGWLLLGLGMACGQTDPKQEVATTPAPAPIATPAPPPPAPDGFLDSTWFKVARLDTFRIGSESDYEKRSRLVKLTVAQLRRYLPPKTRLRLEEACYFYSLQQNTPQRQEITVLHDDGEYMLQLLRVVYDARHKLVSREMVAAYAADGGAQTEAYGRFESPAQFRLTTVQEATTGEDSLSATSNIDSTVTVYAVAHDKFRQLRQKRYQRQKVVPVGQ
ncbi:hypothetical protein GCM10022408_08370 [Hymenobacter fastidiosus]|uniref:Lipoprotein n=1 Tax=Hymenobacter fastidiosus TaxID=486264 RepID=A0ABP7RMK1_9BACT